MTPIKTASQVLSLPELSQVSRRIAITAPFEVENRVLVGMYGKVLGSVCLDFPMEEFDQVKAFLYTPRTFRVFVHGIQRIWQTLALGDTNTNVDFIEDTELMGHMLDTGREPSEYSLGHLAHQYLGEHYPLRTWDIFDSPFPEGFYPILCNDAQLIYGLAGSLPRQMTSEQKQASFLGVVIALILAQMNRYGIGVDGEAAAAAYDQMRNESDMLKYQIARDREFNLWNGQHVRAILKEAGVRIKGQTAEVNHEYLKKLAARHPLAFDILKWRELTTDLDFLKEAAGKDRIHPTWNPITKTGRIYASDPAVQNASKAVCRPLLVPAAGCVLLKADYKQLQIRILANLSRDPALIEAFRHDEDVHWLTVEMCGIGGDSDKERRDKAKAVNYGIMFQMSARGLAEELGTDTETAQHYIDTFWSRYTAAREYLDSRIKEVAKKSPDERVLTAWLGISRRFPLAFGSPERRQAKASLLQLCESAMLKLAMMGLYGDFRKRKMQSRIVMVIHDAIWVEAPAEEADQAKEMMRYHMEDAFVLPWVPFPVEFD